MNLLVYTRFNAETIAHNFGEPEYSYYFVLKEFLPLLHEIGRVQLITRPLSELAQLVNEFHERGEACIFLSFTPPHTTFLELNCPVVPVFAWEFSSLPDEDWSDGLLNNWKSILQHCGAALTHSSYSVAAVKAALGPDFPVSAVPSPVWDGCADMRAEISAQAQLDKVRVLHLEGCVLDSRDTEMTMPAVAVLHRSLREQLLMVEQPPVVDQESVNEPVVVNEQLPISEPAAIELAERHEFVTSETGIIDHQSVDYDGSWQQVFWFAALMAELEKLQEQIRDKNEDLYKKQQEIYAFSERLLEKEADLAGKQQEIDCLSELVHEKERELHDKHNEILCLQAQLFNGLSPTCALPQGLHKVVLQGCVYTAVFNPADGRKNWQDMLTAFCTSLRDCRDATLVFKITHHQLGTGLADFLNYLQRLRPFSCRVVIIWGYLNEQSYRNLIAGSNYALNASFGEGQCMPLMEFMSCGVPAIAPASTALADYITDKNAFVVAADPEITHWQHDGRRALRTLHYRPRWQSLCEAFTNSYQCIHHDPERYHILQQGAVEGLRLFCSRDAARIQLQEFLTGVINKLSTSSLLNSSLSNSSLQGSRTQ